MRNMDYYSKQAKKLGYKARSVFKLEEIQNRFKILQRNQKIIDIGSSPGSWSQFAIKKFNARVIGIDIKDTDIAVKNIKNFIFILGDIFNEAVEEKILKESPVDIVLSDSAPSTTGNRGIDSLRSCELGNRVFDIACKALKKGGNLVIKVFQGSEEKELLDRFKSSFEKARAFKPKACRKESYETYFIGFEYL